MKCQRFTNKWQCELSFLILTLKCNHFHRQIIVNTNSSNITVDPQRAAEKEGWPVGPSFFPRPTPRSTERAQKRVTLSLHALLCVTVEAEMQMLSPLDRGRSGGLLCEEGDERVGEKECLLLSQPSHWERKR